MSMFSVSRLIKFDGEGSLKAYCDLAIGDAVLIKGVRVLQGKQGLFVSMPRQQGKDGRWYSTVEILTEVRHRQMGKVILDAYRREEVRAGG